MTNTFDTLRDYFRDADEETKREISLLEKSLKKNELYVNLGDHDGIKLIRAFCLKQVAKYNLTLQEQDIKTQEDMVHRASLRAYRDSFMWFDNLFLIAQSKVEAAEKRAEDIKKSIQEE